MVAPIPVRIGRVQRQVKRAFLAGNGRPMTTADLARWCYPRVKRYRDWHYRNVRRAAEHWAERIAPGRGGQGHSVTWRPKPELLRLID